MRYQGQCESDDTVCFLISRSSLSEAITSGNPITPLVHGPWISNTSDAGFKVSGTVSNSLMPLNTGVNSGAKFSNATKTSPAFWNGTTLGSTGSGIAYATACAAAWDAYSSASLGYYPRRPSQALN